MADEQHNQEDMIDDLPHRGKHGKIYCPHCKKESPDYYDNCIHCGKMLAINWGQTKLILPRKDGLAEIAGT